MTAADAPMTRPDTDLHDLSLVQLAARLRQRSVSALETAQHFLARAKAHDGLGVYLARDEAVTRAQSLGLVESPPLD